MLLWTVLEFEKRVFQLEEIVIVIRATRGTMVEEYEFKRKAADNSSVTDWLETRIYPRTGENQIEVIGGNYSQPHGRTRLDTLRATYGSADE